MKTVGVLYPISGCQGLLEMIDPKSGEVTVACIEAELPALAPLPVPEPPTRLLAWSVIMGFCAALWLVAVLWLLKEAF